MKDYQFILTQIKDQFTSILQDELIGIYVHGSIAFHCFHWANSDIDFVVVVKHALSKETKHQILDMLYHMHSIAPPKGLEMSIVQEKYCRNFVYPTPYELHYSNQWQSLYLKDSDILCNDEPKTDPDLAAHFTIIKELGIELCGESIDQLFSPVPTENYIQSLLFDVEDSRQNVAQSPTYVILNLCRVLAYLKHKLILSKEDASKWGISHLDPQYKSLLEEAQISYTTNRSMRFNQKQALSFCNYTLDQIHELSSQLI